MTRPHPTVWLRFVLPVLIAILGRTVPLPAQDPVAKKPIPDAGSLQQAMTLVEEVYGGEFKRAKTVDQKTALAERLLQKAKESAADPTSQFALLRVAKDIAALAGDSDLALRAVDDTALVFQIEAFASKVETLLKTAQSADQAKQYPVIVGHATALIELAVQQDDFDTAGTLSQTATAAARKCGDSASVKETVARGKEIDEMASAYAAVKDAIAKLKTDPVDAEANLAVGKYRCLVKGEWAMGISYLALGNDENLKALAIKELKGVSDADGQVALGDGWWNVAATSEGRPQNQLQERAAYWYRMALPGLTGLAKDRLEKRIQQVAVNPVGPQAPGPAIAPFDEKTAKQHQSAWAKHLGVPVMRTNSIGMRFVLIPPGEFDMGSTEAEVAKLLEQARATKQSKWYIDLLPGEAPKHRVRITRPFYLGLGEVTHAEYERVIGSNPSKFKGNPTRPVEMVNWDEASAFCRKLGELPQEQAARGEYRLPTEAEWEYACRAGTTSTWYSGDSEAALKENAWFHSNAEGKTHPVGQKWPNAWGLYDMHGNVWEWCQDWWAADYYGASPTDDPPGAPGGSLRVFRGGGWSLGASICRASYRRRYDPGRRNDGLGFRLVRAVSLASPAR